MAALPLAAQPLKVYSEFSRISPAGEVVEVDRSPAAPREILSPAVPRNGFASYHVVATIPANTPYIFEVGQNPEAAVKVTVYREIHDANGIPDKLELVALPYESKSGAAETAVVFWMDLWIDKDAPVRRIKVEPELNIEGYWFTYPMEVRVSLPIVPAYKALPKILSPIEARSDSMVQHEVQMLLCGSGTPGPVSKHPPTIREFIDRNVQQDMALARNSYPREDTFKTLFSAAKVKTTAEWCAAARSRPADGLNTEWYLKVRDFLYRATVN